MTTKLSHRFLVLKKIKKNDHLLRLQVKCPPQYSKFGYFTILEQSLDLKN